MPLLPSEPALYPEALLETSDEGFQIPARWWVLHTRPRAEKNLARRLYASKIPFFLPLFQRIWRVGRRTLTSHLPLFPGYVFFCGDDDARLAVLKTNLIAQCLYVDCQEELHSDLARVHRMIASGAALSPEDRMTVGTPVEIKHGPLAGIEGIIVQRRSRLKFLVAVQFLQRGASVEIEAWMVEPLMSSASSVALQR